MKKQTTCQLRKKAAEIIEKQGLCKHNFINGHSYCLIGSLARANNTRSIYRLDIDEIQDDPLFAPVRDAVAALGFDDLSSAATWNDDMETTAAEVIARLREGCEP